MNFQLESMILDEVGEEPAAHAENKTGGTCLQVPEKAAKNI